ncbi:MAG: hypothetical protein HYW33_01520 [Candidatus Blackburnbacteria bacterium]|nr:hypothetical protein [Candidatus Blackburnbacteria bacterium]
MPAAAELTRRGLINKASGLVLLPRFRPDFATLTEQSEAPSDPFLLGQQVSLDTRGKVVVSNLFTGVEKQFQLPVGDIFGVPKISPNGETAALWCAEPRVRRSSLFLANLANPNVPPEKIFESTGSDETAYIRWSPDSQWVNVTHGTSREPVWKLFFLPEKKQYWSEYYSGGTVTFSPNGRWMLEAKTEWRMLFDLQTKNVTRWRQPMTGYPFDTWSPDSSMVAFITTDGRNRNLLCMTSPETDQFIIVGTGSTPFGFSPDGRFLVYLETETPATFSVFDKNMGRKRTIASLSNLHQGTEVVFLDETRFRMVTVELISNNRIMQPVYTVSVVNAETGKVENKRQIKLDDVRLFSRYLLSDPPLFTNSDWISGVSLRPENPTLYAISLETGYVLKTTNITSVATGYSDTQLFVLQQQAAIRTPKDEIFLPRNGKLHQLESTETAQLLQVGVPQKAISIPHHVLESLPTGENLKFILGDLVTADGKTWWYLRDNKRYTVRDVNKFINNSRFDRRKHIVPDWALQPVEVGEEQIGEKDFFLDWDGTPKEAQRDGGRMILFISGYGTNSESHAETWDKIMRYLANHGWKYTQFLNGTYNVEVAPYTHDIVPQNYDGEHTKRYPPQNLSRFNLSLTRYKRLFPRTKIIIIGHSLGGHFAVNLALRHTDAVETVITLDSPLGGVNLDRLGFLATLVTPAMGVQSIREWLSEQIGQDTSEYLIDLYERQSGRARAEGQVQELARNSVKVFTLENTDDWFVTPDVALLDNSLHEVNGQPVQLGWQLGHTPFGGSATEIFTGHGQILRDRDVLRTIATILS